MADKKITMAAASLAIIAASYLIGTFGVSGSSPTGNSVKNVIAKGDLFDGKITNMMVDPGKIRGVGVYDRNCVPVGNGNIDCHAGIQTKEYGVLNFNHIHNKQEKPCIVQGDEVVVDILDSDGNAKVQRINPASASAQQETEEMTK